MARRGHDVQVLTVACPGSPTSERMDGFAVHRLRPLIRVGNASVLPQLLRTLSGFDLIHLHCPFIAGAELTSLAAALHRTPLVVTYHSDLVHPGSWRDAVFLAATLTSRYIVLQRADRVLFVSQGHAQTCDQRAILEKRPRHCRILPNAIDAELFHPGSDRLQTRTLLGLPSSAKVVGFVGSLDSAHHYKGLHVLLHAVSAKALEEAQVLVVGDGDLRETYQRQAAQLGVGDRVLFHGGAAQEELPPLYRACDVVAMPSTAQESFGLVAAESLACGTPVVASDGPGVRSLLRHGENGYLVQAGSVSDLAERLASVFSMSVRQREMMGSAGRRCVLERFTWQRIGAELESIYGEVAAERELRSGGSTRHGSA